MATLSVRKSFNEELDPSQLYSEGIDTFTKSFDFNDFENISIKGFWSINITHGDHFETKLIAPEKVLSEITVEQTGQTLSLSSKKNTYSFFSFGKRPKIDIVLPSISELDIKGVADISISGFTDAETSISMEGVMNVIGENCNFEQFSLSGNGVVNAALNAVPVTNAHFSYSGIYNINMLMNGGSLTGRIGDIGRMEVSGEISENSLSVKESGHFKIKK